MLDFRIHTFIEVCKYMNFTRAAESLSITQPTVSQHIRWLENEYGTPLFRYEGKKMFLTEAGQQILSVATTMVHDQEFLRKTVQTAGGRRQLRLGATLTVGETLVADRVKAYLQDHPEDRILVEVANTRRLTELLDQGEIDFALVEGYFEKKEYDYAVYSLENYICVCGKPAAERILKGNLGQKRKIRDLLSETLLIREEGSGTREILEKNLKEKNLGMEDFANYIQINNISAIKSLVEAGCGITFLYERAVEKELATGKLRKVELEDFSVQHEFAFIWRKGSVFQEEYRKFFAAAEAGIYAERENAGEEEESAGEEGDVR